tara:strand:- start:98 stop:283 length:186 start_codon:yes stop_codon:yes gene_type:complete
MVPIITEEPVCTAFFASLLRPLENTTVEQQPIINSIFNVTFIIKLLFLEEIYTQYNVIMKP